MVIERLVAHPRLSYVAGLEAGRPAVHVWDGDLRELAFLGADAAPYLEDDWGDDRRRREPPLAWHPDEPRLLTTIGGAVLQWTPAGVAARDAPPGLPADPASDLAFGPGGRTMLASVPGHDRCDVVDLESGALGTGPGWDTGVALHPAGELFATLRSDQGATLVVFGRVEGTTARLLRRALIIEVDGYTAPVFAPDGRHFAVRGNAYEHTLDAFEFPSLRRVLHLSLGSWDDGWSLSNIAFTPDSERLLIGTPDGTVLNLGDGERPVFASPVTALAVTGAGDIVIAGAGGELVTVAVPPPPPADPATVRAFLASTGDLPEDPDSLDEEFELTDGERTWGPGDLETVTEASAQDPAWLQIQARMNTLRADAAD